MLEVLTGRDGGSKARPGGRQVQREAGGKWGRGRAGGKVEREKVKGDDVAQS